MNSEGHRAGNATAATGRRRLAGATISLAALLLAFVALAPAVADAASADLDITKTADKLAYAPGDQITYTLQVDNLAGDPSGATATDVLPPGVTFVSSGPGCSYAPGPNTVTCNYNSIAPGGFATQSFIVQVDPNYFPAGPPVAPHVHQFTTDKVETHVDFNPGETRHETISCPAQLPVMTDGSVIVDHVDQGTGTVADVEISQARSSALGSYEFTITNHATGRAQVKLFGVCLSNPSPYNGHSHPLLITPTPGPAFGNTNFGTAGYHEAGSASCPVGTQPIAPGIMYFGTSGRVVKSEQVAFPNGATGWTFGFVLNTPGTVQVSIRCMNRTLPGGTHSHKLQLKEIFRDVLVAPGTSIHRLSCGTYNSDAKGITATFDFDSRMTLAGTYPQPINRDFKFFNPTAGPLPAHIDLICLRSATGPVSPPFATANLTNTATVQGPFPDPVGFNDTSSVTVIIDANDPPGLAPSLALAPGAKLRGGDDGAVTVKTACGEAAACDGAISLRAKVRRGHGKQRWAVVAAGPLSAAAGSSETVALSLTRRGARKLASWRNDRSVIAETTLAGAGEPVTHRLRLKHP